MWAHLVSISVTWERFARLAPRISRLGPLWSEGVLLLDLWGICLVGSWHEQSISSWWCSSGHYKPILSYVPWDDDWRTRNTECFWITVDTLPCILSYWDLFFCGKYMFLWVFVSHFKPTLPTFLQGVTAVGKGSVLRILSHPRFVHNVCPFPGPLGWSRQWVSFPSGFGEVQTMGVFPQWVWYYLNKDILTCNFS